MFAGQRDRRLPAGRAGGCAVGPPDWTGRTVVCIASGPSLTADDCELVRAAGHPVVVTNTTFRRCPWADVLVGFDAKWWKVYGAEVAATFAGRKVAGTPRAERYGAESPYQGAMLWYSLYRNTGACAVSIAMAGGASRIILLGYDAGFWDNRRHWHEDHPAGLENAGSVVSWAWQFGVLAKQARRAGVPILNASRRTALQCFPRASLEDVL